MVQEWAKQPWKTIYLVYDAITTAAFRFPLWFLLAIPRFTRPRSTWTIERTLRLRWIKHINELGVKVGRMTNINSPNHKAISDLPGTKGLWISPVTHLVDGDLKKWAEQANVECIRIPGYWLDSEGSDFAIGEPPHSGDKVLYHLHGGGYAILSAHPSDPTANITRGIMQHTKSITRTFSIEYRLTTGPPSPRTNPFPAALLDALAGYNYLVNEVGFKPEDIIIEGDSAGGNLALALVRYLVENQDNSALALPRLPGALVLCSPWADLGDSHMQPGSSLYTNVNSDFINTASPRSQAGILNIVFPFGRSFTNTNPYISPASVSPSMLDGEGASFKGFPRTMIIGGGAEIFVDQIRTLNAKMVRDLGEGMVEYYEAPDAIHDYLGHLYHEPERTETLRAIGKWLSSDSSWLCS